MNTDENGYDTSMAKTITRPARKALGSRLPAGNRRSRRRKAALLSEDEALARIALERTHEKEYSLDQVMRRAGYAVGR